MKIAVPIFFALILLAWFANIAVKTFALSWIAREQKIPRFRLPFQKPQGWIARTDSPAGYWTLFSVKVAIVAIYLAIFAWLVTIFWNLAVGWR